MISVLATLYGTYYTKWLERGRLNKWISGIIIIVLLAFMSIMIYPLLTQAQTPAQNEPPLSTPSTLNSTTPVVSITSVNCQITYTKPWYLPTSDSYFDTRTTGNITTAPGGNFSIPIVFTSHASTLNHTVDSVSISPLEFSLLSVSLELPSTKIAPGSSLTITLKIQAPSSAYSGPLIINVSAS
jgi:cytoskeletal protein RodZ